MVFHAALLVHLQLGSVWVLASTSRKKNSVILNQSKTCLIVDFLDFVSNELTKNMELLSD